MLSTHRRGIGVAYGARLRSPELGCSRCGLVACDAKDVGCDDGISRRCGGGVGRRADERSGDLTPALIVGVASLPSSTWRRCARSPISSPGLLGDEQPAWLDARLADLDGGDIETLVTQTNRIPLTGTALQERDKAGAGLLQTNALRMRYAYFRDRSMFVGSGAVEAGCKAIIGQRLKLAGMRWNIPGATGILTLRCQQASNRWDQIWTATHHDRSAAAGIRAESVGSLA